MSLDINTRQIAFVSYQPITDQVWENFYFAELGAAEVEVQYWDVSALFGHNFALPYSGDPSVVRKFGSYAELDQALAAADHTTTLFVSHVTYEAKVLRLFRLFKRRGCRTAFFARGANPELPASGTRRLAQLRSPANWKKIPPFLANRIAIWLKRIGYVKPYDVVFAAGTMGPTTIGCGWDIDMRHATAVAVNSFDYERTLYRNRPLNVRLPTRYAAFLDIYYPYHPDAAIMGFTFPPADWYFQALNRYFRWIEQQFGVDVVIAAHPKAMKYKESNPFEGRLIGYDCTPELVRGSQFVLTHFSNSKNCAVVAGKPILFLTSDYERKHLPLFHSLAHLQARELGSPCCYFDAEPRAERPALTIDRLKYTAFLERYMTSAASKDLKSVDVIVGALVGSGRANAGGRLVHPS